MKSMVLITGASGGIGRALAHQLHSQGLLVDVVGRDAHPLADVAAASRITADTTTPEGAALQGGSGAAVIASSVVARIGVANHEAIAAAKGGVEALVRSAAATYAAQGLRINAVAPGLTETPMTANMLKMTAMREGAARQYPLGGIQSA